MRAVAELDNLRKRYTLQLAREQAAERARVAAAWLPVLDNLELALEHADTAPDSRGFFTFTTLMPSARSRRAAERLKALTIVVRTPSREAAAAVITAPPPIVAAN